MAAGKGGVERRKSKHSIVGEGWRARPTGVKAAKARTVESKAYGEEGYSANIMLKKCRGFRLSGPSLLSSPSFHLIGIGGTDQVL